MKHPRNWQQLLERRIRQNHPTEPADKIKEIIEKIRQIDNDIRNQPRER